MLDLRPYQSDAVKACFDQWRNEKIRRLLVTCATGLGKTVVFCHVAKQLQARTLILVHTDQLCTQAVEKTHEVWPEASVGVVKAERNELLSQVIVASVQTLSRPERLAQLPRFGLIIIDEAHHSVAKSYKDILRSLGAWEPNGPFVLGVTATPKRADDLSLDVVFQKVAYTKSLLDGIREGYLADLVGRRIRADLDLSGVRQVAGDYDERQLTRVVNRESFNSLIVSSYQREAAGRLAVVFACSVEHAAAVAEAFGGAGIPAAHIDGGMPESKRKAILDSFHDRRVQVLVNCSLLTEGWDEPAVECVIMARPTRSEALYQQCVGRGARPYPGKDNCIVMDLVGATENALVSLPTIFGVRHRDLEAKGGSVLRTAYLGVPTKPSPTVARTPGISKVAKWEAEAVDLFGRAAMRWLEVDERVLCLVAGDSIVVMLAEEKGWVSYSVSSDKVEALTDRPLHITYCQGIAEDHVRSRKAGVLASKTSAWRELDITPGQIGMMKRYGLTPSPGMKRGAASDLITVHEARERLQKVLSVRAAGA